MRRLVLILCLAAGIAGAAQNATNVIIFLGDGAGIPTLNAASIQGYGQPRMLYIQSMPHIGLSETSSASSWVTDSAAGMTAIVTGWKVPNNMLSQKDGVPLKTILEYAEERGLSTGVVSNSPMSDATPAACYAHVASRYQTGEIFAQILKPRFGDGVDLVLGPGRTMILRATEALGVNLAEALPRKGYKFLDSPEALRALNPAARRVVALWDSEDFDLASVAETAVRILSRNPKGFFLMVESNCHFPDVKKTLNRTIAFDKIIRAITEERKRDSLILFAADHSYDFRLPRGGKGEDIVPLISVADTHTGEEILVGAEGPGAERVHGVFPNTELFHVMLSAYGWK